MVYIYTLPESNSSHLNISRCGELVAISERCIIGLDSGPHYQAPHRLWWNFRKSPVDWQLGEKSIYIYIDDMIVIMIWLHAWWNIFFIFEWPCQGLDFQKLSISAVILNDGLDILFFFKFNVLLKMVWLEFYPFSSSEVPTFKKGTSSTRSRCWFGLVQELFCGVCQRRFLWVSKRLVHGPLIRHWYGGGMGTRKRNAWDRNCRIDVRHFTDALRFQPWWYH